MQKHIICFPQDQEIRHEAFHCLTNVYDWGYLDSKVKHEDPLRYQCCLKICKAKKSVVLTHEEWLCIRTWVDDAVSIMSDNIIDEFGDNEWTTKKQKQLERFAKRYFEV